MTFGEIEDLDFILILEAEWEGGGGRGKGEHKIDANTTLKQPHGIEISIVFIGTGSVRSLAALAPHTLVRPLAWQAETDGIHCVTRHLPQIKLMANKTLALKSHRETRLDSSGIPARAPTSCY